jgi:hypothetical protein
MRTSLVMEDSVTTVKYPVYFPVGHLQRCRNVPTKCPGTLFFRLTPERAPLGEVLDLFSLHAGAEVSFGFCQEITLT